MEDVVSRRRRLPVRAWDPDEQVEYAAKLPRGYARPVERTEWRGTPLAAVDVTCEGVPGQPCGERLGRLYCLQRPNGPEDVQVNYGEFAGRDPADVYAGGEIVGLHALCPCGTPAGINFAVVAGVLAGMADQHRRVLRLSTRQLTALA
jgi:hypothetical protein